MSDEEDDLFADSDDDDTPKKKPSAKKAAPAAKKPAPAKKKKADDDDDLFDSSESEDEDDGGKKSSKPAAAAKKKAEKAKPMSKKERLEALAKKKRTTDEPERRKKPSSGEKSKKDGDDKKEGGYDSGDSYNSAEFQRTKEDDDFIDTTGEDPDAVRELMSEQHFQDARGDYSDDEEDNKKKRKRDGNRGGDRGDRDILEMDEEGVPTNPIMAVVHKMKRKKREKQGLEEKEAEIRTFLGKMELAAEEDEQAIAERRPAMNKLQFLGQVEEMLAKRDLTRDLLNMEVLSVCKRWIQPMPNGKLGNVTIRQRLLAAIAGMNTNNDNGIQAEDLRRSELGKVVMVLLKHPDETPNIKRLCKDLVDQWSRPIFGRSANMKDLERSGRQGTGLAAIKRRADAQQFAYDRQEQEQKRVDGGKHANLQSLIAGGKSTVESKASANRVRVPFSRGFAFSVRPESRGDVPAGDPKARGPPPVKDNRSQLAKRMIEKGRPMTKNQRSANISVEGRANKG